MQIGFDSLNFKREKCLIIIFKKDFKGDEILRMILNLK